MLEMEMLQSTRKEMRQERKATGAGALVQAVAEDEPVAGAGAGDGNAFACENAELCVSLGKTRGNASGTMHRDCIMG